VREKLERLSKTVQGNIRAGQMRSRPFVQRYLDPYFLSLPICFDSKYIMKLHWLLHSKVVASMMPFDASEISSSTGTVWGYNPDNDRFIIVDRFDRKQYNNGNGVTFGGYRDRVKRANMTEIDRNIVLGIVDRTVVIDPEREFKFPYGQRYNFEVGGQFCTNPFHIESTILDTDDDDGEIHAGRYMMRKTSDIVTWFKWLHPDMDAEEASIISRYIRQTYQSFGISATTEQMPDRYIHPTLSDFYQLAKEEPKLSSFINIIEPYVYAEYASLFNGQTN